MKQRTPLTVAVAATVGVLASGLAACSSSNPTGGAEPSPVAGTTESSPAAQPASDLPMLTLPPPEDFVDRVDNPYYPLIPGTKWVYRGESAEGTEEITTTVLEETKEVEGITATVVHDQATLDGELIEDTFDWYAQDSAGNVWYLGEDTTAYENGKPAGKEGSWEAGVDGAKAGFVMPARTEIGEAYRQEFLRGEAEDQGVILDRDGRVHLALGDYRDVWMTNDTTPLEPEQNEYKFYAPGIGNILEIKTSPEQERFELVKFVKP